MSSRKPFQSEHFITYDRDRDVSICLKCKKEFKGRNTSNIKRHYRVCHFVNFSLDTGELNPRFVAAGLTKSEFLRCCVGLVSVKNLPFHYFDDDEFLKKLIAPYEQEFGTNFNSTTMAILVRNTVIQLKEYIAKTIQNRIVCLKLDVALSNDRSWYLGILTAQYIKDFKIVANTIGVLQLNEEHTETVIKDQIIQLLKEVNIEIGQIYSCTPIGVGSNALKVCALLKEHQEAWLIDNEGWDSTDGSDEEEEDEEESSISHVLSVVRCAEHNIQLAADDVFEAFTTNIEDCRKILKGLRMCDESFEDLDDATKWNSTYTMFKSLEGLRDFLQKPGEDSKVDWTFVTDLVCAFKPLLNCINKFNTDQYIIGDFYRDWLLCELELDEIGSRNGCAQLLIEAFGNRKARLLENEAFLSALYVDPRFNFVDTPFLTGDQKDNAVGHLINTHNLMKLVGSNSEAKNISENVSSPTPSASNVYKKLERKMKLMAGRSQRKSFGKCMEQKLLNLAYCEWIPFHSDVLQYWKKLENIEPRLCNLVQVALSVPISQLTHDSALSVISVIEKAINRLSNQTISDLTLIKLNHLALNNVNL